MKKALVLLMLAGGVGFWYHKSDLPLSGDKGVPWQEVGAAEFDTVVLNSPLPALVYFDAVEGCDGADVVFARLRKRWNKHLNVYYFKAESNPSFARKYGVGEDVVFALFQNGRMVKRVDAPAFLRPLLGPDNQVASFEAFLEDFQAALERFADLR